MLNQSNLRTPERYRKSSKDSTVSIFMLIFCQFVLVYLYVWIFKYTMGLNKSYICMYLCIHLNMRAYLYNLRARRRYRESSKCLFIYVYRCMHILKLIYTYMHIYIFENIFIQTYICMWICLYLHINLHTYTFLHTNICLLPGFDSEEAEGFLPYSPYKDR
jgi:hypothetical protein